MPQTITAIYEHGVFVPQSPIDLPEHTRVKLAISKPNVKSSGKHLKGILAGQGEELSLDDFKEARHEMWHSFPRELE